MRSGQLLGIAVMGWTMLGVGTVTNAAGEPPETSAPAQAVQKEAASTVQSMRGFSTQRQPMPPGDGKISPLEQRVAEITKHLHQLGPAAIPELVNALKDSDVQMRR